MFDGFVGLAIAFGLAFGHDRGGFKEAQAAFDANPAVVVGATAFEQAGHHAWAQGGGAGSAGLVDFEEPQACAGMKASASWRGDEGERDGLVEAKACEDVGDAAAGPFGLLGRAGDDVEAIEQGNRVEAVDPGDLFDEVDLAGQIGSPRGRDSGGLFAAAAERTDLDAQEVGRISTIWVSIL